MNIVNSNVLYDNSFLGGILIKKFFKDIFNKGNFKDYFKRNRMFLIVSLIIVVLSLFTGMSNGYSYTPFGNLILFQMSACLSSNVVLSPIVYFVNNLLCIVCTIIYGLSFSVLSALNILYYATSIGCLINGNFRLYYLFESVILVFTLCASLLVTKMEVRIISCIFSGNTKKINKKIKVPFKDLLMSFVIIIVLLLISLLTYMLI